MSDVSKSVFLSCATPDAEAARKIGDALRAAGVDVSFDPGELRTGDAWEKKIRSQIKECALFVPIVSANTQAQRDGEFRREWRLADQRQHVVGNSKPFVVPVCIDDVAAVDADVPESFRDLQWTRLRRPNPVTDQPALPLPEVPAEFPEQIKFMIACGEAHLTMAPFSLQTKLVQTLSRVSPANASATSANAPARQKNWPIVAIISVTAIVALAIWMS